MSETTYKTYDYSELSLADNPRKSMKPEAIEEMGKSILVHGIIQPPIARQVDGKPLIYMGQRRFLGLAWALNYAEENKLPALDAKYASRVEELSRVAVLERVITDEQMLEAQWVENLQREDVPPEEEAEGYAVLLALKDEGQQPVYTIVSLAEKLGKAVKYIQRRLKLRLAPDFLLEAVNEGQLAASVAELIGRIPDTKAREEASKLVLKPRTQEVPLNYEQTKELIREHFMVSLQRCGFDADDETLVPVQVIDGERVCGGSCADCPFRSGNMEDLEIASGAATQRRGKKAGVSPDLCTKPSCYRSKQDAAWQVVKKLAEQQGKKVISGDAARKVFSGREGGVAYDSVYADVEAEIRHDDLGRYQSDMPKWKEVIKGVAVDTVVARHPDTGKVVNLIVRKDAIAAVKKDARDEGESSLFDKGSSGKTDEEKAADKKEREKAKLDAMVLKEAVSELVENIGKQGIDNEMWLHLFTIAMENSGSDGMFFLGKWLGVTKKDAHSQGRGFAEGVRNHVKACVERGADIRPFLVVALIARGLKWSGLGNKEFEELTDIYKVDLKDIRKRCQVLIKAGKQPVLEEKDVPTTEVSKELSPSPKAKALKDFHAIVTDAVGDEESVRLEFIGEVLAAALFFSKVKPDNLEDDALHTQDVYAMCRAARRLKVEREELKKLSVSEMKSDKKKASVKAAKKAAVKKSGKKSVAVKKASKKAA